MLLCILNLLYQVIAPYTITEQNRPSECLERDCSTGSWIFVFGERVVSEAIVEVLQHEAKEVEDGVWGCIRITEWKEVKNVPEGCWRQFIITGGGTRRWQDLLARIGSI